MFTRLLGWIREAFKRMIGRDSIKQAFKVDVAISSDMATALERWSVMYQNKATWLSADIKSLGLPAAIAGELARAVTLEMKVEFSQTPRATFLKDQLDRVLPKLRQVVEYGCAKGGLMFKPYVAADGQIAVDFVQADQFLPVTFDANGHITACIFVDQRTVGVDYFTRLEYHQMGINGCVIRNVAYKSTSSAVIGSPVPLAALPEWADLKDEATVTNISQPLYAYFRFPQANNIDPASPLGVSCYSRADDLIEQADRQWSRLQWEFESGERAIYVDELAFGRDADGKPKLPTKRLYRALNQSGVIGAEEMFHDWSPEFRDASIKSGLDAILKRIEFNCGLAYGTLSDPTTVEKTATELQISRQRSYATVTDTQKALETALDQLLYAMDVWATLNGLAPQGSYDASYDFDDSVVVDKDHQFQQDARLVQMGMMSKAKFLMRNLRMSAEAAQAELTAIAAEQPEQDFFGGQGA